MALAASESSDCGGGNGCRVLSSSSFIVFWDFFNFLQFLASDIIPASINSRYARIFRRVRLRHRRNEDERLVADADGSAVAFEGELGDGAVERIDGGEPSGVIVVGVRGWDGGGGGGGGGIVPGDGDGEKCRELLLLVMESLHRYLAADAASALEASLILSLN
ncbi:hypothetical protein ACFX12_003180 [Malus domestica]